ncbi:hypothetical protein ACLOJK_031104 [Asimina triloba]
MDQKSRREGSNAKKERKKLKKLLKKEVFGESQKVEIPSVNKDSTEILKVVYGVPEDQPELVKKEKQRRKPTTKKKRKREKGTEVDNLGSENEDHVNDIKCG